MSDAERPIDLDEYVQLSAADSNLWWKLSSGHHLNLLDESLERLESQQAEIERLRSQRRVVPKEEGGRGMMSKCVMCSWDGDELYAMCALHQEIFDQRVEIERLRADNTRLQSQWLSDIDLDRIARRMAQVLMNEPVLHVMGGSVDDFEVWCMNSRVNGGEGE